MDDLPSSQDLIRAQQRAEAALAQGHPLGAVLHALQAAQLALTWDAARITAFVEWTVERLARPFSRGGDQGAQALHALGQGLWDLSWKLQRQGYRWDATEEAYVWFVRELALLLREMAAWLLQGKGDAAAFARLRDRAWRLDDVSDGWLDVQGWVEGLWGG